MDLVLHNIMFEKHNQISLSKCNCPRILIMWNVRNKNFEMAERDDLYSVLKSLYHLAKNSKR